MRGLPEIDNVGVVFWQNRRWLWQLRTASGGADAMSYEVLRARRDPLHVLSSAAGNNLRWLLRWIGLCLDFDFAALYISVRSATKPRSWDTGIMKVKFLGAAH